MVLSIDFEKGTISGSALAGDVKKKGLIRASVLDEIGVPNEVEDQFEDDMHERMKQRRRF